VSEPQVHVAAIDDLDVRTAYRLWQLREAAFVVEQECPYPELDGRDLEPGTRHVWVEVDATPVGYLRVLEDGELAKVGRVVVTPSHRGTGVSDLLMRTALEVIGERRARLDAQSPLARWYSGFGFVVDGPEFVEDGIAHLPMSRTGSATRR
jgi:ElaA protein